MAKLLPCPDCGCTDITLMSLDEYEYSVKDSDNSHWAVCDSCKRISLSKKTAEEAIDAWNEEATKTKMGSDNSTLKPCPFCGGEVKMYKEEFGYGRFAKVIIEHRKDEDQENCIRMSYLTAEEAIRHWNKRDTDA